jgi:predicted dehydrogenase
MPNHQPKVAVIGSGYWGRNLVRNYHQLGALGLICNKNELVLSQLKDQHPGVETCVALNDVLSRPDKLLLYPHEIRWQNNVPVPTKGEPERVELPQAEPLRRECEHFLHCMIKGCQPITDGREGLQVLRILNASQQSLDGQGCRVFLDSDPAAIKPRPATEQPRPSSGRMRASAAGARSKTTFRFTKG